MNSGYTGNGSTDSMISYLNGLSETRIGGGTYGQVYNPGQFLGQLTVGNTNYGISSDTPAGSTVGPALGNAGLLYCPESPKMS